MDDVVNFDLYDQDVVAVLDDILVKAKVCAELTERRVSSLDGSILAYR